MRIPILISTERPDVVLRQYVPQDARAIFSLIDNSREHLSQFGEETSAKYPDVESVLRSITDNPQPNKLRLGIWRSDELVGSINLTPFTRNPGGHMGYYVGASYLRQGLATAAARACVDYALHTLWWRSLLARARQDNRASQEVLRRAGLEFYMTEDENDVFRIVRY